MYICIDLGYYIGLEMLITLVCIYLQSYIENTCFFSDNFITYIYIYIYISFIRTDKEVVQYCISLRL